MPFDDFDTQLQCEEVYESENIFQEVTEETPLGELIEGGADESEEINGSV